MGALPPSRHPEAPGGCPEDAKEAPRGARTQGRVAPAWLRRSPDGASGRAGLCRGCCGANRCRGRPAGWVDDRGDVGAGVRHCGVRRSRCGHPASAHLSPHGGSWHHVDVLSGASRRQWASWCERGSAVRVGLLSFRDSTNFRTFARAVSATKWRAFERTRVVTIGRLLGDALVWGRTEPSGWRGFACSHEFHRAGFGKQDPALHDCRMTIR